MTKNVIEEHTYWEHAFTRPKGVKRLKHNGVEVPTQEYTEMKAPMQGAGGRRERREFLRTKDDLEMVDIDGQMFSRWEVRAAKKWWRSAKKKGNNRARAKRAKVARKINR